MQSKVLNVHAKYSHLTRMPIALLYLSTSSVLFAQNVSSGDSVQAAMATVALTDNLNVQAQTGPYRSENDKKADNKTSSLSDTRHQEELQEIIVTANKRPQTIMDVSASIAAIGGESMEASRVKGIEDLKYLVPGLQVTTLNSDEQYIGIRGSYTNTDAPASAQGVAVFVDDVATTGPDDLTEDYFDLDHVEVLRGPQGTLFGRNVTGGVVSIYTSRPSYSPEGRVAGTYGNYNQHELQALVTGPLMTDRIAGKLTMDFLDHDGFIYNADLHDQAGGINHIAGRGQLLFDIRDHLRLIVGAGLFHDRSQGVAHTLVGTGQPVSPPFYNPAGNPVIFAYGPWNTNSGFNGYTHRDNENAFARLDWSLRSGTLTSISGYRSVRSSAQGNPTGDPGNAVLLGVEDRDKQFTQEIRFASPSGQRFSWIVGTYYIYSDKFREQDFEPQYAGAQLTPVFGGFAPAAYAFAEGAFQNQRTILNGISGFGELGYDILPTLNLTVGARETHEHKAGSAVQSGGTIFIPLARADGGCSNPPTCAPTPQHDSWGAFTPKATLAYKPSRNLNIYLTTAKGFKAGGFDYVGLTPDALSKPYSPEYATNYEAGFKTLAFDDRFSFNAALYREDYTNLQVRQNFTTGILLNSEATNVGKARAQGVEIDASFRPTRRSQLGVNYAYTDFKYENYVVNNGTGDTSGTFFRCVDPACTKVDLSGHEPGNTPRQAVSLFGQLDVPVRENRGRINFYADVAFRTEAWADAFNNDAQFIRMQTKVEGLLNSNLNWISETGKFKVSLWAKNITNVRYVVIGANVTGVNQLLYGLGPNDTLYAVQSNEPRTFGVTVTVDVK